MDEKPNFRKQGYEINPKRNFGTVFTVILGLIAYYQFARDMNLVSNIILLLIVLIIVSIYFLVVFYRRVGKLVQVHNNLIDEYENTKDNRDTLKKMIDSKNIEIDDLDSTCSVMKAQIKMLLHFAYHEDKPRKDIVLESLSIDYEEVDSNEK